MTIKEQWLELAKRFESLPSDTDKNTLLHMEWEIMRALGYKPHLNTDWFREKDKMLICTPKVTCSVEGILALIDMELPALCFDISKIGQTRFFQVKKAFFYSPENCALDGTEIERPFPNWPILPPVMALCSVFCRAMAVKAGA